jgi:hypothetical protein
MNNLPEDTKAYFIKLGEGGEWEDACLADGKIRFGYHDTPHRLCGEGRWDEVHAFWKVKRGKSGTATNDTRQIRTFYEADEAAIFITFAKGYLWWCHPSGKANIHLNKDGTRVRKTVDGWKNTSLGGAPLLVSRLSGKLTKTQMFRGTICEVKETAYLLRRINDELTPELAEAEAAEQVLLTHILAMVQLLDPRDFELMVELIFSRSGWQRQASTGGTQKTLDLDLLLPTTGERAFVQVKSETDSAGYQVYADQHAQTNAYDRMFFVWHTGGVDADPLSDITLWGPSVIARHVLGAGLLAWLKDRIA